MPCGDITESLKLTIDEKNRLETYSFSKKTCGGAIGLESLILDSVAGQPINNIIENKEISFAPTNLDGDEIETYLRLKHFYAIQSVLNVYLGFSSGGADDSCTIAGIEYDAGFTIIDADIKIDLLADKIKACDHCGPN